MMHHDLGNIHNVVSYQDNFMILINGIKFCDYNNINISSRFSINHQYVNISCAWIFQVSFYVEQSEADNHAVREAACSCIAELASKVSVIYMYISL